MSNDGGVGGKSNGYEVEKTSTSKSDEVVHSKKYKQSIFKTKLLLRSIPKVRLK